MVFRQKRLRSWLLLGRELGRHLGTIEPWAYGRYLVLFALVLVVPEPAHA